VVAAPAAATRRKQCLDIWPFGLEGDRCNIDKLVLHQTTDKAVFASVHNSIRVYVVCLYRALVLCVGSYALARLRAAQCDAGRQGLQAIQLNVYGLFIYHPHRNPRHSHGEH
jgi:hypothetical protein